MTDSPMIQVPLDDPREQPILDKLYELRSSLLLLKQDHSTYIKSQDFLPLYDAVVEQVHLLNQIRGEKREKPNRVDRVLDDCFQLISLFFLRVGRIYEAPSVYAATSTIKRLLDHLVEATFYSAKDLESIGHTLDRIDKIVERGKDSYSPDVLKLLEARVQACRAVLSQLHNEIAKLSPQLAPVHEKLISILRCIAAANTRQQFPTAEVKDFQNQLREVEASLKEGDLSKLSAEEKKGIEWVETLLSRCLLAAEKILERKGRICEAFQARYAKLVNIRNQLEKLSLLKAWALRETDLFSYQRELDKEDEARVNGEFVDENGKPAEMYTQRTLLYLLRRSYAYIYSLIISSEPVSEALLPIYNQLQTLRKCLVEVKQSGGVSSPRELYPYTMKLTSIENMRVDGKFMVGEDIPEGQGTVNDLLAECYELMQDLRVPTEGDSSRPATSSTDSRVPAR
ncbi:MAG: hypothetical protein M1823_004624 [Watsoniomyces obsoletus]|nr:MAG: hypothetical protein M1823_004624 [Watsoniomyces obsoletus]